MKQRRGRLVIALFGAQLAACAPMAPASVSAAGDPAATTGVVVREDSSGRFIALIGPNVQFEPPFLGVSDTNVSRLRSFFDRRNGDTAHQLYVAASYEGNHDWTSAHDSAGQALTFIPMSRFKIACDGKDNCSYAEEFAAKFPESELSNNPGGFSVTFTDAGGDAQTVRVSAAQVTAQLDALDALQKHKSGAPPTSTAAAH